MFTKLYVHQLRVAFSKFACSPTSYKRVASRIELERRRLGSSQSYKCWAARIAPQHRGGRLLRPRIPQGFGVSFQPKVVRVHQTDLNPIDLEFLSQFRALEALTLVRVLVKSWCWLRKVGVPSLVLNLYNIKMPSSAFVGIRVKRLSIVSNRYVHTPLSIIEGLGLASFDISVHNVAPNEVDNYKALSNLTCKDVVICITTTNSQSLQRWESHTKKWETLMN